MINRIFAVIVLVVLCLGVTGVLAMSGWQYAAGVVLLVANVVAAAVFE